MAEYFDHWYADMTVSPVKDEIQQRHLGLPPHLLSSSLLGWEGIAEAVTALRLSGGATLVDLACGRGGYGLEIAGRTGARLIGVDFSAEAVRQATEHARRWEGVAAEFRVGDLASTGLADGVASGVLCVDAIQFAPEPQAAYQEIRRILAPGGRAALTCWEPREPGDERLPARLRHVDLAAGLTAAGFGEVEVRGPMLKRINHPRAGLLEFECQVLHIAETGQRLIAYCATPGSATEQAFIQLSAHTVRS